MPRANGTITTSISEEEHHTYRGLYQDLYRLVIEPKIDLGIPVTQADVAALPEIVRLTNEAAIIGLGLNPAIRLTFRLQVTDNNDLERSISESEYYRAIDRLSL